MSFQISLIPTVNSYYRQFSYKLRHLISLDSFLPKQLCRYIYTAHHILCLLASSIYKRSSYYYCYYTQTVFCVGLMWHKIRNSCQSIAFLISFDNFHCFSVFPSLFAFRGGGDMMMANITYRSTYLRIYAIHSAVLNHYAQ